jgi:hypothetical protein
MKENEAMDNAGFWWEHLQKKDHLEELGMDDRILKEVLKYGQDMWTRFSWLRVQTGGKLL